MKKSVDINSLDKWWCYATNENRDKLIQDGFELLEIWEEDEFIIYENNECGLTYALPNDFKIEIRIENNEWVENKGK